MFSKHYKPKEKLIKHKTLSAFILNAVDFKESHIESF
jgi:hypothetical protein